MSDPNKPLVSLVVTSFNHEHFVGQAVAGAFSQTYSPLEIILSDDASSDRSYAIMQEMAQAYSGPHLVRLNRNSNNSGSIGAHLNILSRIAKGELLIAASADDISTPARVCYVVSAWLRFDRKPLCIASGYETIDHEGRSLGGTDYEYIRQGDVDFCLRQYRPMDYWSQDKPRYTGAAMAYSMRLFREFGDIVGRINNEDDVLVFRSYILGEVAFVNLPLVRYRLHDSNSFFAASSPAASRSAIVRREQRNYSHLIDRLAVIRAFMHDLSASAARGTMKEAEHRECLAQCVGIEQHIQNLTDFHTGTSLRRIRHFVKAIVRGVPANDIRYMFSRLFGKRVYFIASYIANSARAKRLLPP